jgi:hypothetical protein
MSIDRKKRRPFLATVVTPSIVWLHPSAFAQSGSAPASVQTTGRGQRLIDPSNSVTLLLVHQPGPLQTAKDISIGELRNSHSEWLIARTQRQPRAQRSTYLSETAQSPR